MHLQNRDILLLLDVYKYRYLSFSQLTTLHFPSDKSAYRRLHKLVNLGFLKVFHAPNIPGRIFYLDKEGAEIVAGKLQVPVEALQWYRYTKAPKDYQFLKHFLAVNDIRILVTQACDDSPVNLLGFIPEYFGEKTAQGNVRKYIRDRVCDIANPGLTYSHTPDGVFALEKDGKPALFFLEVDQGGEIISDPEKGFLKCVVFYLNYWADKKFTRYNKDFDREFKTFHTLILTSSLKRLENIREEVSKLPFPRPVVKRLLWAAVTVSKETFFTQTWYSLDATDNSAYRIG